MRTGSEVWDQEWGCFPDWEKRKDSWNGEGMGRRGEGVEKKGKECEGRRKEGQETGKGEERGKK